jgi:hypothetical protein
MQYANELNKNGFKFTMETLHERPIELKSKLFIISIHKSASLKQNTTNR